MTILVTGAAGYVGSHFCVKALEQGHEILAVDNLSTSSFDVIEKIEQLSGKKCHFMELDLNNRQSVHALFEREQSIDVVVHFAAVKHVHDSLTFPLKYYFNNLVGSFYLLEAMERFNVNKIVFSSTAAIYTDIGMEAYQETVPTDPLTAYGKTKKMFEDMLFDLCKAKHSFSVMALRYFNAAGAHPSGLLGETLGGKPGNLIPFILKVAGGERDHLSIFGKDYPTPDGTALRDYVHVMDLVEGHMASLDYLENNPGFTALNLGRGVGTSVLEVVKAFEEENQVKLPCEFHVRRPGDLASVYADVTKARQLINWKPQHELKDIVKDAWNYYQKSTS